MYRPTAFGRDPFDFFAPFDPFRDFDGKPFNDSMPVNSCRTDIKDMGDKYVMESELPGFEKEDIKLDINDSYLVISAEHEQKEEHKDENGKYIRKERHFGSYKRSFDISDVDADNISAEYKNGILTIDLPKKKPETPVSKRLEIK